MVQRSATLAFTFLLACLTPATLWAVPPLLLQEAVKIGLSHSPAVLTAEKNYEVAKLGYQNAKVVFYPSIDLSATHGLQGSQPGIYYSPFASSTSLTMTENIYDNGQSLNRLAIAEFTLKSAEAALRKARGQTIITIATDYWAFCQSSTFMEFAESYQKEIEKQSQLANQQFHQGLKTLKDYLNLTTQAQRGSLDLTTARNNFVKSKATLIADLGDVAGAGYDFNTRYHSGLQVNELPTSVSEDNIPDRQILNYQKKITELQVRLTQRLYWPQVNLSASGQYGSQNYIPGSWTDNQQTTWNALVTLTWNLWDWGQRRNNIEITRLQQEVVEQPLTSSLLNAQNDLANLNVDLKTFTKTYAISRDLKKNEEQNFKYLENQYREGAVTYLELLTSLANLQDAKQRASQADFDLHRLWLKAQYYLGRLNEESLDR